MIERGDAARPLGGVLIAAMVVAALAAAPVSAQANDDEFDEARAYVSDETLFVPFRVTDADVSPLRDVLAGGVVQSDTWLMIMEHDAGRLAMVMDQMAYHHVAQGDLNGEPWMVSF
ncbi:MAG: hypothetical protein ACC682_13740 [Gemmatimonadota bacterium]